MATEYEINVLAHIEMHKTKGETEAVKKHMAAPVHKAIVEAAAKRVVKAEVPTEPEDAPDKEGQEDKNKGKNKDIR